MAVTKLNETLWSTVLLKGVVERMAFNKVVADQGQVDGAKLNLQNIGDVNISDYTKDSDITNQVLTDTQKILQLSQQKYFSVSLDDVDAAQTSANVMGEVARKGSAGLALAADTYIATVGAAGATITSGLGTSTTPLEINKTNAPTTLSKIARKLADAKADPDSMWIVLPPWYVEDLVNGSIGFLSDNMGPALNGFVGKLYGLNIYQSTNVQNTTSAKYQILFGDKEALRFGHNVQKLEGLRNPTQFGDVLRGLFVYGCVATQPETLGICYANEAADS